MVETFFGRGGGTTTLGVTPEGCGIPTVAAATPPVPPLLMAPGGCG